MATRLTASFIAPMLLLRTDVLPNDAARWLYELKFDGYRAIAFKTGGTVFLRSRNNKDFTVRYPAVVRGLGGLPDETVIDGEVVAFDEDGRPSFNARCRTTGPPARQPITSSSTSWSWPGGMSPASRSRRAVRCSGASCCRSSPSLCARAPYSTCPSPISSPPSEPKASRGSSPNGAIVGTSQACGPEPGRRCARTGHRRS
jgi:hypothetical protein